uniref:Ribosomal RNA-processing protein 40 n=2 Tax=Cacopsylla melanoneura TaxID=428564 RepID=A0A8D8YF86_9HEMI
MELVNSVVMAGDSLNLSAEPRLVLGPGLRRESSQIIVSQNGILRHTKPFTYYVDYVQRRYVPTRGDTVIGVVTSRSGENYRVDIGSADSAVLSYLAFEGATKKNPPKVETGDVVAGKLLTANKDMESELVCVDSRGKEFILGILSDGYLLHTSIHLCRKLLNAKCPLLKALATRSKARLELVIGMNGKIWLRADTFGETVRLGNLILRCELMSNEEIQQLCETGLK